MINNVLICGIGAIGLTIASKIKENFIGNLKILTDETRLKRYIENKPIFNGTTQNFDYILPNDTFRPDLIIICVKSYSLNDIIHQIKNFVTPNVKIISMINGITSEEIISKAYPLAKILKSYFIGHSAVRTDLSTEQDGVWEIVCENNTELIDFFKQSDIKYANPQDIDYSMWLKYTLNLFSNQTSAVLEMTFGELKNNKHFKNFAENIIEEVRLIADKKGICKLEHLKEDAIKSLDKMCDSGKTSMLQDVLSYRKTEVDIFAGEIIKLGKLYGIKTPYNQVLYDLIKIKEELNEYRIHTC